jgi:opacity protein-like surface antigen
MFRLTFATACALTLALPAVAQDWSGNVTLYGWLPTIEGETIGPDGTPILDITAEQLLDALDSVYFATGEVRRGEFALLFDLAGVGLSSDAAARPPFTATAALETDLSFGSLSVGWRAVDNGSSVVDLYAGARAFDTEISVGVTALGGGVEREITGSADWVDPIIGLRGRHALGQRFGLVGFADAGGFGVGSDLTWQVYGGLSFDFSDSIAAQLGYRYMSIDYSGDIDLNINLSGPVLGLSVRF